MSHCSESKRKQGFEEKAQLREAIGLERTPDIGGGGNFEVYGQRGGEG